MGQSQGLYSVAQVRAFDAYAIAEQGIPAYTLMRRAGEAALRVLRTRWPMASRLAIVCGGGNNGGDGYVLARYARAAGLEVEVLAAVDPAQLRGYLLMPRCWSMRCWAPACTRHRARRLRRQSRP